MWKVRPTRTIYIENDPALREILSRLLAREPGIEMVASLGSAAEALTLPHLKQVDAALIDYSLGEESLNGLELGIALRAFNEDLGILIYSQFDLHNIAKRIPASMNHGWGFATKSGTADISHIAKMLISVSQGHKLDGGSPAKSAAITESSERADDRLARYSRLSERQRATMKLASQGYSAKAISERLGISYDMARQELSRAYRILIPTIDEERVLSVSAIIAFSEIRRELENSDVHNQ